MRSELNNDSKEKKLVMALDKTGIAKRIAQELGMVIL